MVRGSKVGIVPLQAMTRPSPSRAPPPGSDALARRASRRGGTPGPCAGRRAARRSPGHGKGQEGGPPPASEATAPPTPRHRLWSKPEGTRGQGARGAAWRGLGSSAPGRPGFFSTRRRGCAQRLLRGVGGPRAPTPRPFGRPVQSSGRQGARAPWEELRPRPALLAASAVGKGRSCDPAARCRLQRLCHPAAPRLEREEMTALSWPWVC